MPRNGPPLRRRLSLGVAMFLLVRAGVADAQTAEPPMPARLAITPSSCPADGPMAESFAAALRVELGAPTVLVEGDADATVALETTPCVAGGDTLRVTVRATATGSARRQDVDVGDLARASRPRALAIAVAELLRAEWPSLASDPSVLAATPPPPAAAATAAALAGGASQPPTPAGSSRETQLAPVALPRAPRVAAPPAARPAPRRNGIGYALEFEARGYASLLQGNSYGSATRPTGLLGGRASASIPLPGTSHWRVAVDLGALYTSGSTLYASASVGTVTAGAAIGASVGWANFVFEPWFRVEAGIGWAVGNPYFPDLGAAGGVRPVLTTALAPTVRARLSGPLWVTAGVEAGLTWLGFTTNQDDLGGRYPDANAEPVLLVGGLYGSVRAGLAWGY